MSDTTTDANTPATSASAQVVIESLIKYAQHDYESKRIGWESYATYTVSLYNALCGMECSRPTTGPISRTSITSPRSR